MHFKKYEIDSSVRAYIFLGYVIRCLRLNTLCKHSLIDLDIIYNYRKDAHKR